MPSRPVDLEAIRRAAGGDAEFEMELIAVFLADAADRVSLLDQALCRADRDGIAREAHRLKGSSADVGAGRMREIAAQLEHKSKQGAEADDLRCGAEELIAEYRRVKAFLENRKAS
jgi:HPt (histidine-containing phosphotransfer) domain-containing protein